MPLLPSKTVFEISLPLSIATVASILKPPQASESFPVGARQILLKP